MGPYLHLLQGVYEIKFYYYRKQTFNILQAQKFNIKNPKKWINSKVNRNLSCQSRMKQVKQQKIYHSVEICSKQKLNISASALQ